MSIEYFGLLMYDFPMQTDVEMNIGLLGKN